MANSKGFGSDGSNSNILLFGCDTVLFKIALLSKLISDSTAFTTLGAFNWLTTVNETQKTKIAKLIKNSFTFLFITLFILTEKGTI